MKKTLMIALAGMMLFAFTQCGGEGTKKVKGSREYQETMEMYQSLEKAVKAAKTCDELEEAALNTLFSDVINDDYTDEEMMTEQEKEKVEKYIEELGNILEEKVEKLGCDDD